MELFEQIRREYTCGVGSIKGVAKKLEIHRRMDGVAVSVADCWHCAKSDCISSVSMSSWMCGEEEIQERIRRSNTCQRQERNGEAAHGNVRTRTRNKSSRRANGAG